MPLRVSGKNLDIGESLRTHVTEKVEALIGRYFDGKVGGHVVIQPEGSAYRTDCSLQLSSGVDLQAEGRAHEPYASFEQAADRIERRLRRYKKRLKENQARGDTAPTARRIPHGKVRQSRRRTSSRKRRPTTSPSSSPKARNRSRTCR